MYITVSRHKGTVDFEWLIILEMCLYWPNQMQKKTINYLMTLFYGYFYSSFNLICHILALPCFRELLNKCTLHGVLTNCFWDSQIFHRFNTGPTRFRIQGVKHAPQAYTSITCHAFHAPSPPYSMNTLLTFGNATISQSDTITYEKHVFKTSSQL